MKEVWVKIQEAEDEYYISNFGNAESRIGNRFIRNIKWMNDVPVNNNPKRLKTHDIGGYLHMRVRKKHLKIHRMVAKAFIPNPKSKPQVNHIDGNKHNNHVSNLEWCTHNENMSHASKNGLMPNQTGERNGNARLINSDIYHIKLMLKYKYSYSKIANIFYVSKPLIARISQGKAWTHISIN